jgi:hypothetical protein
MRKRRRVDLAPRLSIGSACTNEQADQADEDAAEHAGKPSKRPNQAGTRIGLHQD